MELKIKKLIPEAIIPAYSKEGDAGLDLYSINDYTLYPNKQEIIQTGLSIEIHCNYFGSIRDRSGLAAKYAIHTLAGVVDSGYRGEIKIVLINLGKENYEIKKGDRIAQMVIQLCASPKIVEVDKLSNSFRGEGGFGSTGN